MEYNSGSYRPVMWNYNGYHEFHHLSERSLEKDCCIGRLLLATSCPSQGSFHQDSQSPLRNLMTVGNLGKVHVLTENWIARWQKTWNLWVEGWENRLVIADATKHTAWYRSHDLFQDPQCCVRKTFSTYFISLNQWKITDTVDGIWSMTPFELNIENSNNYHSR